MLRRPLITLALLASSVTATQVLAESYTTRIEPRAYYGAVVTLEQGVRVWRPLPPTRHMIINPDGRTPLNLTVEDVRQTVTHNNHVHVPVDASGGSYGAPGHYGGRAFNHRGHRPHRHPARGLPAGAAHGGGRSR